MLPKPVSVADGEHGVLIFHLWKNKIPEGVQIGSAAAAPPAPKELDVEMTSEKVDRVRIGIDSFLKLCSITTISVLKQPNGYCKIYVNFEIDPSRPGYNEWAKSAPYFELVRNVLFDQKHESAKINRSGKKVSVIFSDKRAKTATKMLTFVSPEQFAEMAKNTPKEQAPKKVVVLSPEKLAEIRAASAATASKMKNQMTAAFERATK